MENTSNTIEQIAKRIRDYQISDSKDNKLSVEKDITDMISLTKQLIKLKEGEITAYTKFLTITAHSFKKSDALQLVDSVCSQSKKELTNLETLQSELKSLLC